MTGSLSGYVVADCDKRTVGGLIFTLNMDVSIKEAIYTFS